MELSKLVDLFLSVEREAFKSPWSAEMLSGSLDENACIGLCDVNGNLLSYGTVQDFAQSEERKIVLSGFYLARKGTEFSELLRIAVRPEFRRRGFARILMANLRIPGRILLEVAENNVAAIELYKSTGYQAIANRKNYYSDGSNCLVMEKIN